MRRIENIGILVELCFLIYLDIISAISSDHDTRSEDDHSERTLLSMYIYLLFTQCLRNDI